MKNISILLLCLSALGCMDQDPFNNSQRMIIAPYRLERFEDELYYIETNRVMEDGCGVVGGTVEQIGWTNGTIFVKRYSCFRGDPDGWMTIDVQSRKMSGPVSESEFRQQHSGVSVMSPKEAWKQL